MQSRPIQPQPETRGEAPEADDLPLAPAPALSATDVEALRTIARLGGGARFVPTGPKISTSNLRRLREAGLVDLLPHPTQGDAAQITARGLKALAQNVSLAGSAVR